MFDDAPAALHATPEPVAPGVWHKVVAKLCRESASYEVDGAPFASAKLEGAVPESGFFGLVAESARFSVKGVTMTTFTGYEPPPKPAQATEKEPFYGPGGRLADLEKAYGNRAAAGGDGDAPLARRALSLSLAAALCDDASHGKRGRPRAALCRRVRARRT